MNYAETDDPPILRHSQTMAALASLLVFGVALTMSRPGMIDFLKTKKLSLDEHTLFIALAVGIPTALAGAAFALYARWGGTSPSLISRILAWPGLVLNSAIPLAWFILWVLKK
ncbi:MAG: hypothetical protein LBV12_12815 [Puniceicoccales bacterium]|jgi:hypothetical protein|nr:hypothetical protein [Puniceicoccales bacterium]